MDTKKKRKKDTESHKKGCDKIKIKQIEEKGTKK